MEKLWLHCTHECCHIVVIVTTVAGFAPIKGFVLGYFDTAQDGMNKVFGIWKWRVFAAFHTPMFRDNKDRWKLKNPRTFCFVERLHKFLNSISSSCSKVSSKMLFPSSWAIPATVLSPKMGKRMSIPHGTIEECLWKRESPGRKLSFAFVRKVAQCREHNSSKTLWNVQKEMSMGWEIGCHSAFRV